MEGSVGLGVRWARAGVLALVTLLTASAAHVSGGGYLPGLSGMVALFVLTTTVAVLFLAQRAGTAKVVALLVGGQTLVHGAFATTAGHAGEVPPRAAAVPAPVDLTLSGRGSLADQFDSAVAAACGTCETTLALPGFLAHAAPDLTGPAGLMALLHLLAAAVVGLYVAAGERALWALVDHLRTTLVLAFAAVAALLAGTPLRLPARRVLRSVDRPRTARDLMVVGQHSRRGPPLLAAV